MTILSPALDAAFAGARVTMFGALRMQLPEGLDVRLLDGSAEIEIDGQDYYGHVDGFGSWESIDEIEDGFGDEAPGTSITILPESDEAAALMSDPDNQGSVVTVMVGARDDATGLSIGDPYVPLRGIVDVPVHAFGLRKCSVDFDIVSEMDYLMLNDEDRVMSSNFHRRVWPDEAGMDHVTGVAENGYWGTNPPTGGVEKVTGWKAVRQAIDTNRQASF